MITFPIPRSKYAREYTLQASDATLNRINPFSGGYGLGSIYLCCLTVAGIAAFGYPARTRYTERLSQVPAHWGIRSWCDAERMLESFAWLKCACNAGGAALRAEALKLLEA